MSTDGQATLREYCRGQLVAEYSPDGVTPARYSSGRGGGSSNVLGARIKSLLCAAFLPEGFPDSVTPDYLGFQAWDTVQALSSYVRGMLTSQAILRGVGVGQQAATPLAAVFLFFVRDLAGMLGGILFAFLEGSSFDSCAKQWRLFADIINDVGMTVELASPLFPSSFFLPIACFGSIARSMTGVAGGATRAALTQHFARRGNAADVAAKEQSQETATTMVGMVLGMLFTRATADHAAAAWLLFAALTVLHVYANVRAMRCLVLSSFNQPRLDRMLECFLQGKPVPSPQQLSQTEDLTPPPFRRCLDAARILTGAGRGRTAVQFGSRITDLMQEQSRRRSMADGLGGGGALGHGTAGPLEAALLRHAGRRYLVYAATSGPHGGSRSGSAAPAVQVVLHQAAEPADVLQAYVHASCLAYQVQLHTPKAAAAAAAATVPSDPWVGTAERASIDWVAKHYQQFLAAADAAGWAVSSRIALPRPVWAADWQQHAHNE